MDITSKSPGNWKVSLVTVFYFPFLSKEHLTFSQKSKFVHTQKHITQEVWLLLQSRGQEGKNTLYSITLNAIYSFINCTITALVLFADAGSTGTNDLQ